MRCRKLVGVAVGVWILVGRAEAQEQGEKPRLPPPPIAPTSNQECTTFAKAINDFTRSMSDAHSDCISAHMKELGLFATDSGRTCAVAACRRYHDFFYGDMPKEGEREISVCYDQVREYQRRLATEEHVIEQAGGQQRAATGAQGRAQVSVLNAKGLAATSRAAQASQEADRQRQIAVDASNLADIYRARRENASSNVNTVNSQQLAALERAQLQAEKISQIRADMASAALALDLNGDDLRKASGEVLRKWAEDFTRKGLEGVGGPIEDVTYAGEQFQSASAAWLKIASKDTAQQIDGATDFAQTFIDIGVTNPVARKVDGLSLNVIRSINNKLSSVLDQLALAFRCFASSNPSCSADSMQGVNGAVDDLQNAFGEPFKESWGMLDPLRKPIEIRYESFKNSFGLR